MAQILYEDITLEKIDYEWIEKCSKIKYLKKAVKLIEADGDYFVELKQAVLKRMEVLDPTLVLRRVGVPVSEEERQKAIQDIFEWEDKINKKDNSIYDCRDEEIENHYLGDPTAKPPLSKEKRTQLAEAERIKGNEAIRSGDLDEALRHYTSSIELDARMASSYCNRSLIHLKKKDYERCIHDATVALKLDPNYVKALLRRAKALANQKKLREAAADLRQALQIEPGCKEASSELADVLREMKEQGLKEDHHFKKIAIMEEEEDLEQIE